MQLLCGLPAGFWPRPCKRIRDWRERGHSPSLHTGAYNQARQALPLSVVQQSCDRIFEKLVSQGEDPVFDSAPRAFLLDGSSMRLAHTPELCRLYPPGSNQHGEGHWPVLRVLVAHDLRTGLAMRPEWGAMYGAEAISEQRLLERAIQRLPQAATVVGDANFGVFSVAWTGTQCGHPVLLRMTAQRAQRLAGEPLRDGIDRPVQWKPTREDRRTHPDLPKHACLQGRLCVQRVQPNNGGRSFLLALFTTLSESCHHIMALYGQRWTIETDVRTLKKALMLEQLTCSTPDMMAKEIDMGIAAYNLVRAVTCLASRESGIPPRGYSFTTVRTILQVFGPKLAAAPDQQTAKQLFQQIMRYVQQAKLPRRRKQRATYPRQVWPRGATFPSRKP